MTRRWLVGIVGGTLVLASLAGLAFERGLWRFNDPEAERFPVRGVDVCHHQGAIDWRAVAREEHITFAYLKATEGRDWVDARFAENWKAAREAGLRVGAYHFFTFCSPPLDQATHFLAVAPVGPDTLPPVLDVELGGNCALRRERGEVTRDIQAWIDAVEARTNREVVVYATREAVDAFLTTPSLTKRVWIRDIWCEPKTVGAHPWLFWQFANRARVEGIDTFVDLNVFRGSESELNGI